METKVLILETALSLFSIRGFDSTPVREIADRVGVKDSSLYFHFKNKHAILMALMDEFIQKSEGMMTFLTQTIREINSMTDEQFLIITERYLSTYLLDDFIRKFSGVMALEQRHDALMRENYVEWCIAKPVNFQRTLFEKLQAIGFLAKGDAYQMAVTYFAPIYLFYQQYVHPACDDVDLKKFHFAAMTAAENFLSANKGE